MPANPGWAQIAKKKGHYYSYMILTRHTEIFRFKICHFFTFGSDGIMIVDRIGSVRPKRRKDN